MTKKQIELYTKLKEAAVGYPMYDVITAACLLSCDSMADVMTPRMLRFDIQNLSYRQTQYIIDAAKAKKEINLEEVPKFVKH